LEDLVGIRIICYFLSDYEVQYEFVKQNFWIIRHEPVCKPTGYKADHFVVTLNEERIMLVEYNRFKHIKFEIQVCTVLEHAWNEIEHDRGYKGELPSKWQSRFQLLARGLHRLDERFQKIAIESVNYESALSRKKLEDIPISPPH
jgi:ppGpp synthetase/RelA/SpoT-type nucleotidyltranferase